MSFAPSLEPDRSGSGPRLSAQPTRRSPRPGSRAAIHDPRWPWIVGALAAMRKRGRYAVRIVDADCGAGSLLLHAVHHARALGFTAIEGRGIDGSPALIGRARAAARRCQDPSIGLIFDMVDIVTGLREEQDLPADLVLWHGAGAPADRRAGTIAALEAAGESIIADCGPLPFGSRTA